MNTVEFNKTVDLYSDNLYRFILKSIRDTDKARDVVQDTFEKMWQKVDEIPFDKAKSYMFTTGYRTMIDMIRKDSKQTDFSEVDENNHSSTEQYSGLQEVLHEAANRLPEIQRNVIMLRDYEGYSYEEIGEVTGLTESQVKVYIFRARKAMKAYLVSIEAVI